GIISLAFTPGFSEVALQQLGAGNLVDDVTSPFRIEIPREIRNHFRGGQRMQSGDILVRPRILNLTEQSFERFVVCRQYLKRRAARPCRSKSRCGAEACLRWARAGRTAGIRRSSLIAALPGWPNVRLNG